MKKYNSNYQENHFKKSKKDKTPKKRICTMGYTRCYHTTKTI